MYGCESWTVKKAECWRIDAFELWCWRRLLRVPWTARRSNQSILKEISPGCSLEGLMVKLKLQYFGHLMRRVDSLEKTLMLGGIGGRRRRGRQRMRSPGSHGSQYGWMASPTRRTWVWVNSGSWWWTGRPDVLQFMGSQRAGHDWATELNWTFFLPAMWNVGWKVYTPAAILRSQCHEMSLRTEVRPKDTEVKMPKQLVSLMTSWDFQSSPRLYI